LSALYRAHRIDRQEFWDSCSEAGPANRAATPFEEPQPALEVLAIDDGKLVLLGVFFQGIACCIQHLMSSVSAFI